MHREIEKQVKINLSAAAFMAAVLFLCTRSEQAQSYTVYYLITVDKHKQELSINVSDEGIQYFVASGNFLTDPVAHLGHWTEYLWEEYEGCTFDPETGEYVY